jgi:hypothetical protein
MKKKLAPAGAMLVGAIFVCLCIVLGMTSSGQPFAQDLPGKVNLSNPGSANQQEDHCLGKLELPGNAIYFPWSSQQIPFLEPHRDDIMPRSAPVMENIVLDKDHPPQQLHDLKAMNAVKQREIVSNVQQSGDRQSEGLINTLDVCVSGKGNAKLQWHENELDDNNNLELFVDNATQSGRKYGRFDDPSSGANPGLKRLGNFMNIEVSGVSVSAINTVEGGSAVATSNIIIKPVQIIICPPEVEEKLK